MSENIAALPAPAAQWPKPEKLPPIATTDLCTEFYNEPRVHDLLLAERLGFKRPADIRSLIVRNKAELEAHGALVTIKGQSSVGVNYPHGADNSTPARRGPKAKEFWLNEGQALTICALARTSMAAAIRRQLVTVFMAYRRGTDVVPVHVDTAVADVAAVGASVSEMKAEIAKLHRSIGTAIERMDQQGRVIAATAASDRAVNAPRPARALKAPTALLYGVDAIGEYLGLRGPQVYGLHCTGRIPTYKVGWRVCADTRTLDKWMATKGAEAVLS